MAEDPARDADDDLELKPTAAGTMFRLEMFTTNFLLGYWKHILAVVVSFLVLILAYGQFNDYTRRTQRDAAARIAERLEDLPQETLYLSAAVASGEEVDVAKLQEVADGLMAIGNGTSGTARVEAYLTAAELYRLANLPEKQRGSLTQAVEYGRGVFGYSATSALANLELAQGEGEAAVQRLRALAKSNDGYLAEQAEIDLGLALEHLGRTAEAEEVYTQFLTRFPDSPRRIEVKQRQQRISSGSQG